MSKELVIGSNRHETKVAILEEDQLVEVYFQRANEYSLAGSIHKGRVTRVLPGMQSAFVDLGLERDTFLYVSDFFEEHGEDIDTVTDEKPQRIEKGGTRGPRGGYDRLPQEIPAAIESHPVLQELEPHLDHEEEEEEDVPAVSTAPAGGTEARLPEQARQTDRNDDRGGNDRRGRRSRRRRRGRDFPENKYARPGGSSAPATGGARSDVARVETGEQAHENFEAEPPIEDVIVLPGESLAKYRSRPVIQEPSAAPLAAAGSAIAREPLIETPEEDVEPDDEPSAEAAEIEEEASELQLTEQVFDHHHAPEPLTPEQEDAIGRAASYLGIDRAAQSLSDDEEHIRVAKFLADPSPVHIIETSDIAEPTEHEMLMAEEALPDLEDIAPEIEEALENGLEEPYITLAGEPEPQAQQSQSAVVRDQGNRSLHRAPRRMRRRRGGSGRFNQGGPSNAAGAAPQVDARPDNRAALREAPVFEERVIERPERTAMPSISELLKPGQEIIVQIAKEPLGQKGARITSHIALPGRYVVFMPSVAHLGVSRKVSSDEERLRLKRILQAHRVGTSGGFIVRTAGEGVPEEEIAADMNFLYSLWLDIRQKAEKKPAPALLHYDLDIVQRILRDQVTEEFKAIWVDNEELYESVVTFMQRHQPALVNRVKMYTRSAPVFDAFNITQELEKALRPKVWLKSGGYIVINQTEALVAIDINTGKFVGKSNRLEDTIVKTNVEAVKEIVRQIRLRDLGGIIVVDFIDMDERKNRQRVMQALEEAMRSDKAPYKILQFNDFGLVAITRKRVKQSLERTLCAPCPHCEGAGYVKSVQTIIGEILVEAQKISKALEGKDVMLRVNPDVAKVLKAKDNQYLEELEEILARPVLVKGDATLHNEKFDLG
jgi:ribonuclease G